MKPLERREGMKVQQEMKVEEVRLGGCEEMAAV